MSAVLALSVSDRIEQYGAYAGFAAVLGLAVLSLLYFAQAREVKRLREWAGRAPERAAELQERVQADATRRVVAQPQARPSAAVPTTPAAQAAQAAQGPTAAATTAGAATASPPTTVQPAVNGAAAGPVTEEGTSVSPARPAPAPPRPGQPLRVPATAAGATAAGAAATSGRGGSGESGGPWPPAPSKGGPSGRVWAMIGGAVVLIVAVVLVVTQLTGGDDDKGATRAPAANTIEAGAGTTAEATPTTERQPTSTRRVVPANTTVAVLNGTTVPGLARSVATQVEQGGFRISQVTNASDQARAATLVEYAEGRRREAQAVARRIGLGSDAIRAMEQGTRVIAGDDAQVVVTVGADQNQTG